MGAASPVPVQMWAGRTQSWCRCGSGEPSPGADVAAASPVPVQMWARRAESRCRCGSDEPSSAAGSNQTWSSADLSRSARVVNTTYEKHSVPSPVAHGGAAAALHSTARRERARVHPGRSISKHSTDFTQLKRLSRRQSAGGGIVSRPGRRTGHSARQTHSMQTWGMQRSVGCSLHAAGREQHPTCSTQRASRDS